MRIDRWPFDRIMSLPDWCFGRRWLVSVCLYTPGSDPSWDMSELALPEKCVIWKFACHTTTSWADTDYFRLALGDQLPTTTAQMDLLEPLFNGLGLQGAGPRHIPFQAAMFFNMDRLRFPVATAGRKLIVEVVPDGESRIGITVGLVVSSLPKEIPDWLILAADKSPM